MSVTPELLPFSLLLSRRRFKHTAGVRTGTDIVWLKHDFHSKGGNNRINISPVPQSITRGVEKKSKGEKEKIQDGCWEKREIASANRCLVKDVILKGWTNNTPINCHRQSPHPYWVQSRAIQPLARESPLMGEIKTAHLIPIIILPIRVLVIPPPIIQSPNPCTRHFLPR